MIRKCIVIGVTALGIFGCSDLETGADQFSTAYDLLTNDALSAEELKARFEQSIEEDRQENIRQYKKALVNGEFRDMQNLYDGLYGSNGRLSFLKKDDYFQGHAIHEQLVSLYAEVDKLRVAHDYPGADEINSAVYQAHKAINQLHSALLDIPDEKMRASEILASGEQ